MPSLFAALLLAGCDRVDPDSPLGKRKAIYQAMLDTKEDLGGMLRGRIPFDGTAFTSGAAKLDELSRQPWQHYPEVRKSRATRVTMSGSAGSASGNWPARWRPTRLRWWR